MRFLAVRSLTLFGLAALVALLASCTTAPPSRPDRVYLEAKSFADLPGWREENLPEVLPALLTSCKQILARKDSEPLGTAMMGSYNPGKVKDWRPICRSAETLNPADPHRMKLYFQYWFQPYLVSGGTGPEGLFTGYYEAELRGSLTRKNQYQYPLYGLPNDLIRINLGDFSSDLAGRKSSGRIQNGRFVPYHPRSQIEVGALKDQKIELVFVDDPDDAYFLAVQGSGRILLDDGSVMRVGYAGSNGQAYVSIGSILVDMGQIPLERVSLKSIREWLKAHPEARETLYNKNPSYVFFREIKSKNFDAKDGPIGAMSIPLTAGASLAVDRRYIVLGLPMWLDLGESFGDSDHDRSIIQKLVVAQDTGGAIRGAVRGDLFYGFGEAAEQRSGSMRRMGSYYVFLPKSVAQPPGIN